MATTIGQETGIMDMTYEHIQVLVVGCLKRLARARGTLFRERQKVRGQQLLSEDPSQNSTAATSQEVGTEDGTVI